MRHILLFTSATILALSLNSCFGVESAKQYLNDLFHFSSDSSTDTEEVVAEDVVAEDFVPEEISVATPSIDDLSSTEVFEEPSQTSFRNRKFTGTIGGKYKITAYLNLQNGDLSGKYAYKTTLDKYGDSDQSYMYLYQEDSNPSINQYLLNGTTYEDSETTEMWNINIDGNSITGTVTILATGKTLSVELN